jgi:DNA-binding beta-propeller fold protein YncE
VFIADYYNGLVRVVGPDGIIRNVSPDSSQIFGAPTRVAFDQKSRWLYVADASTDQVMVLNIPKSTRGSGAAGPRFATPKKAG